MDSSWIVLISEAIIMVLIATAEAYPYAMNATDIGAESAFIKWRTTETNVEEFKVHCSGVRHYVTVNNEPRTELDVLTHYVPGALNHLLLGNLQPNFNYSCIITEDLNGGAYVFGNRVSEPFHFATDLLGPEEPKIPEIHQPGSRPVSIILFPVSSKFGPILGYKVQFLVTNEQAPDGTPILDENMMVPFGKFSPANQQDAVRSTVPLSFQLTFSNSDLPPFIGIDSELLMGALKNNAMYSVVTIAYTKNRRQKELNSNEVLFTASKPSQPFVAKGYTHVEPVAQTSTSVRPRQLSVAISVGVILPLLVVAYLLSVGLYLVCREQRLRNQQRKSLITREDIKDASQLRRTQRHNDLPWLQSSHEMGDLPWLDLNSTNDTPSLAERDQSTPISHRSATQVDDIHGHGSSSKNRSIPQSSTGGYLTGQMGYTISEPTKYDISNFHPPGSNNDILILDPHPYKATAYPIENSSDSDVQYHNVSRRHSLPYTTTTTVELHINNDQEEDDRSIASQSIQSPTRFFSAPDFSEVSPPDGPQPMERNDDRIPIHSSSSMFIPRGLSSGPQLLVTRSGAQPSPIQTLFNQLSQASLSQQEDQAPDLELDMYDITIA